MKNNMRELSNTFRRMGDDANHDRLWHIEPRKGQIKADTMIRETSAAAAAAYYNCMRHVQALLPNTQLTDAATMTADMKPKLKRGGRVQRLVSRTVDYQVWTRSPKPWATGFKTRAAAVRWRNRWWPEIMVVEVETTVTECG